MQQTVKRAVVVALMTAGALGLTGNPASAQPSSPTGDEGSRVVTYKNTGVLENAEVLTVNGKTTGDGGCSFEFPNLKLSPNETAIQARQISTDFANCTTKVEIGVPAGATSTDSKSVTESVKAGAPAAGSTTITPTAAPLPARIKTAERLAQPTGAAAIAAVQSTGYYRVWWEDIINLDVHEVKSNVRWSWDNYNCVWGYSGWTNYSWLSASGWSKNSSNQAMFPSCGLADYTSVAVYRNGAFCWPGVVWSYYDNVRAQGRWDGWLLGSVTNTYTTYPFACPTLHWNAELRRTQN